MNIKKVLEELDQLFEKKLIIEVEPFLLEKMEEAKAEGDLQSLITLLNEAIGFYRDTSQYDKSLSCCSEVKDILEDLGMQGTVPYATTMLNIANAHRAAGSLEESMAAYAKVFAIYEQCIEPTDFRYASLFNNLSLLYQEMGDFERAAQALTRALEIVSLYPEARIELATTHTNLAASLLKTEKWQDAKEHLKIALSIFEETEEKDYHYSAALAAMGEYLFKIQSYQEAKDCIQKAMRELEAHVGKTEAYYRLADNLEQIEAKQKESKITETKKEDSLTVQNGMDLCRAYFDKYGQRILEMIPGFENHIAAGLVGEGSDCYGWDDAYSRDHDWGPGFCIWLTDQDYAYFGELLQEAYQNLPPELDAESNHELMRKRRITTPQGKERMGVMRISDFYERLLGVKGLPKTDAEWLMIPEDRLAAATNGCVFTDPLQEFSKVRKYLLSYYPETVRKRKLAQELALMAQTGQYNYLRMLKRGEDFSAELQLADYMKHTMKVVYLLNKKYAPHDKWLHRGMRELPILPEIGDILTAIHDFTKTEAMYTLKNGENQISMTIEIIAKLIVYELQKQGLSENNDTFLMTQAEEIMTTIRSDSI